MGQEAWCEVAQHEAGAGLGRKPEQRNKAFAESRGKGHGVEWSTSPAAGED